MQKLFADTDKSFLLITAALSAAGFLILASASGSLSERQFQVPYYYVFNQFIKGFLPGLLGFCIGLSIPYTFWRKAAVPLMLVSLVLMALVFMPSIGMSYGGATRWLSLGPITFQPSEILKLSLIMYLASWLESRRPVIQEYSATFIPFVIIMFVVAVFLGMQPDLGTLSIMCANAIFMYFVGGSRVSQIGALIVFGLIGFFAILQLMPYSRDRIMVFLNPESDPLGKGYQVNHAFIAIGSGGFWGRGVGESFEKYGFLPEPIGDSIFAVFAEEFGFIGSMVLILLFLVFIWRGLLIASGASNVFGKLLGTGIIVSIAVQAFVNIGANAGILPLTGVPLPFISYGGTSLTMSLLGVGILSNIAKQNYS